MQMALHNLYNLCKIKTCFNSSEQMLEVDDITQLDETYSFTSWFFFYSWKV